MIKLLAVCLAGFALPLVAQTVPDADLRVRVVTVSRQAPDRDLQLSGQIEALDSLDLGFRLGGRVAQVLVVEGDRVRPGQPLARLNAVQQDQALNAAQAGLASARAGVEQARQARDRARALLDRGVGTRAAADQADQALSQAQGASEQAQTNVERAQRAVDDAVLRAPRLAVVTAQNAEPGQVVAPAQPVVTLATLPGLEAVFQAPDVALLRDLLGRDVRLETLDIDRPDMTGTVTEVSPLVDAQTGTVTVRVRIADDAGEAGLLGAAVRGQVSVLGDPAITVPWTALMRQGDDPAVWVLDADNRVSLNAIRIEAYDDGIIYVADGLSDGARVVGDGSQMLYPGRIVTPLTGDAP